MQTNSAPPETPYPSLGDHTVNTGVFVRNVVRRPPPPGAFVQCHVEDLTLGGYLAAWGRASGLAPRPGQAHSLYVPPAQYDALWGPMAEEQTTQWKFLAFMREHADEIPLKPVRGLDRLTEEEKKELVSTEDSLKAMDWTAFKEIKAKFTS